MRLAVLVVLAAALAGAPAVAQQTIDEALTEVQVFNCTLEGEQALFVFRTAPNGAITLIGEPDAPVRLGENGLSVVMASGLREISDGAYHVYQSGAAASGTCSDITEFTTELYPAITAAYAPDAAGMTVAEQAAAAQIADLTVRMQRAEADQVATQALFDEVDAARDAAETALAETSAELVTLKTLSEEQSNTLAEATAQVEDLSARLAATMAERDVLAAAEATLTGELTAATTELDRLRGVDAELAATQAELDDLKTLHASVTEAATQFQGQLGEVSTKLDETTATNRSLVATVSGLNTKISELGDRVREIRTERDAAVQRAAARPTKAPTTSLTRAAIARLATLQGRSQNAVRSELCRVIGGGSGC